MLYQLKDLTERERQIVKYAPVWVILYVACADNDIQTSEIDRGKEIIQIKSYAEKNDVRELYDLLKTNIDQEIDLALKELSAVGSVRLSYLEENLAKLNDIFPKLDSAYAKQLYKSLRSLAREVAKSSGFFGIGIISELEEKAIQLPMLKEL
jgi:hypothetical protein